jgi:hypothetical protein
MTEPSLAQVMAQLDRLTAQMRRFEIFMEVRNRGQLAPEEDYFDETVRFCPRDWPGDRVPKGARLSQCSPGFLLYYADALDSMAAKQRFSDERWNGAPAWRSNELAARRARRWAYRLANSLESLEDVATQASHCHEETSRQEVEPWDEPDYMIMADRDPP